MNLKKWRKFDLQSHLLIFLIITFIAINYIPALNTYLMSDDFEWLQESNQIWHDPAVLFHTMNHFFRPLLKLSFLLDFTLFRTNVFYYNVTNILLHLFNVYLLFLLIYRISKKKYLASLIALFFGSSPMYSEVTLWASSRPDSILLLFILGILLHLNKIDAHRKISTKHWFIIVFLTFCAIGSKDTWLLLPFFALSFLWIVKRTPFMPALKNTLILFIFMFLYVGYFIVFPILSGTKAPTAYAGLNTNEMIVKFQHIFLQFFGLGSIIPENKGYILLFLLILLLLSLLAFRLIRVRNWLALWGMIWMLMSIAISLPIRFIPSRYNYLPLLGFWVMVTTELDFEFRLLTSKYKLSTKTMTLVITLLTVLLLSYNSVMLQWEINDYRVCGQEYEKIVKLYKPIHDRLPRNNPIIFVNASRKKSVNDLARSIQGLPKVLFVRERAINQLIFISTLVNFVGNPYSEIIEPIPPQQLNTIMQGEFTVLAFNNIAFFIADSEAPRIRKFYKEHGNLPYKVEALQFINVKN